MPIESLKRFLPNHEAVTKPSKKIEGNNECTLVVQYQAEYLGFKIDSIEGQQQVFIRPLKGYLSTLPWLTGSTILSNGEPSLIVNLKEVTREFSSVARRGATVGKSHN